MTIKHQYLGFLDSHLLWHHDLLGLTQHIFNESITIPKEVIGIKINDNEVLGKRIEHFFEHYIRTSRNYTLIAKNIQVFKNKTTIGELDFLIKDTKHNNILHIELVYKFYVYDPTIIESELKRWIGPNRKDSFLEKIDKLIAKQLPLLHHPETNLILEKLHLIDHTITQQVCFIGNVFVPLAYKNTQLPFINNQCIAGFWIHSNEFTTEDYSSYLFYIPQKKDWVVQPIYNKTWFSYTSISEQITIHIDNKKSPLLWMKSNEDSYSKFFIVWW